MVYRHQVRASVKTTTNDADQYPDVNVDPFHVDTALSPELRASALADTARWVDGWVGELATLARKAARLQCKLMDPALAADPHRPDAVQRSLGLDHQVMDKARAIVWTEAGADRVWQSLTVEERGLHAADFAWRTRATEERLVGAAWFRFGPDYAWPVGWRLDRLWLAGMPLVVVMDLRIHGVMEWSPNPPAPSVFTSTTNEPMPMEIARLMYDEKGNPR
jgi:hypothetical protein